MEIFRTLFSWVTSKNVATLSTADALRLTKKRLRNLRRRNLGLQQLAVRQISEQLTFYRKHPDELEKLENLPGVLRDKILQYLMKKRCLDGQGQKEEFKNLKAIFPLLLSPRTRYIELNGILSFSPDRYKNGKIEMAIKWCVELLKQIETRAPQVETLIIDANNPFYKCSRHTHEQDTNNFRQEMVQSLMKLQKLNRLQVKLYSIDLKDLLKICKNLSRLEYVQVECVYRKEKYQPAPKEVLSSFCNLKELIIECPRKENDWLGTFCTRKLPNLEVVQYDLNEMKWMHIREYENRYYYCLNSPGGSNLRHVCVDLEKYSAEEVEAMPTFFPKVTCLTVKAIKNSSLAENLMPKYDNIKQLQLFIPCGSAVIKKYLICYGQKLQSIYLGHDNKLITIDLELIFKHCPKLEKLSLLNTLFKTAPSKIEFFAELKELELENAYHSHIPDGSNYPDSMALSTILSAPKLEKVKLVSRIFYKKNDGLWKLNSLIREKQILKNLHTLHVYHKVPIPEALANVLKSACAFLPKLTDFKFGCIYKSGPNEDPLLACQPTPLSDIDARVLKMNHVFEKEK